MVEVFSKPNTVIYPRAATSPGFVHGPRVLAADRLLQSEHHGQPPFGDAHTYLAPTVNAPAHLLWTMNKIVELGGKFVQKKIASFDELPKVPLSFAASFSHSVRCYCELHWHWGV